MTQPGTKVGDVYVEIETRLDTKDVFATSRRVGREAGEMFGKGYLQSVRAGIKQSDQQFSSHMNQQVKSWQMLNKQREAAFAASNKRIAAQAQQIFSSTANTKQLEQSYASAGNKAGNAFASEMDRTFKDAVMRGLGPTIDNRTRNKLERDYERDSRHFGHIFGHHMQRGFEAVMSLLPARLENLFTRTGPILGSAFFAAFAAGFAIGLPALGAMISGALFTAIGAGAVAAGIALVAKNPAVLKAAGKLRDVVWGPDLGPSGKAVAKARSRIEDIQKRISDIQQFGARTGPTSTTAAENALASAQKRISDIDMFGARTKKGDLTAGQQRARAKAVHDEALATEKLAKAQASAKTSGGQLTAGSQRALAKAKSDLAIAQNDLALAEATHKRLLGMKQPLKEAAQSFVKPVVGALTLLGFAFEKWLPFIKRTFEASSKFVMPMTRGLVGFIDGFIAPMTRLMESKFLMQLMDITSLGFGKIGESVGRFFDRFLADPKAMEGATLAMEDLFDLIAGGIGLFGQILQSLSSFWEEITGKKGSDAKSKLEEIRDIWRDIRLIVGDVSDELSTIGNKGGDKNQGLQGLKQDSMDFLQIFRQILAFLARPEDEGVRGWWRAQWDDFRGELNTAWTTIRTQVGARLAEVRTEFMEEWAIWRRIWFQGTGALKLAWNTLWGSVKAAASAAWAILTGGVSRFFAGFRTIFAVSMNIIKMVWNTAWGQVKATGIIIWNSIIAGIRGSLNTLRNMFFAVLRVMRDRWNAIWGSISTNLSGIWDEIVFNVKRGFQGVIDVINTGIRGINEKILAKLGLKQRIPEIPDLIAKRRGGSGSFGTPRRGGSGTFAHGGLVRGRGTTTSDSINARLSDYEYVVNAKSTKKHLGLIEAINRDALPGFAGGGLYESMFAWIKSRVPGAQLSSGHRPGDPGYHGRGQAVDLTFADGSERRGMGVGMATQAFNLIKSTFFAQIRELIWDFAGGGAVWNGKHHFFTGSGAGPGTHADHIHWAMGAGADLAKAGGGVFGLFANGWNWVKDKMVKPALAKLTSGLPDNALGWIGRGAGGLLGSSLLPLIKKWFDSALSSSSMLGVSGDPAGVSGSVGTWIAEALRIAGKPASWAGPLATLVMRESGGNPRAINLSDSNAARGTPSKGLAQVIGPTFAAYRNKSLPNDPFHPIANLVAALNYITAQYGSIFNVQQANASMSPRGYDSGGYVPTGDTLVRNQTGRPELLLSHAQEDSLGRGDVYVTVMMGDEIIVDKVLAVVDDNNNAVAQAFRRGRG